MWASLAFEVASAAYGLSTVVTDVILNYEYINRHWLEEYILSIVFLVVNAIVTSFVGLRIDQGYPNRFSYKKSINTVVSFGIGLLQMRVLVETIHTVVLRIKSEQTEIPVEIDVDTIGNARELRTIAVNNQTITNTSKGNEISRAQHELLYVTFVQAIVRDIPLFVLQANATIHYRKWHFIDLFTVISTFISLAHGTAAYVAKEDGNRLKVLAFGFLVGQFVFRLGAILLLAMTKGLAILVYGIVITVLAILWTVRLCLAHPSHRFIDQVHRAIIYFPLFTLFVIDGSRLTAECGSAISGLRSRKLLLLHLWRCLENIVGILLATLLPRYTDFGVSSDETVVAIGGLCFGVYLILASVFHCASKSSTTLNPNNEESSSGESLYRIGLN